MGNNILVVQGKHGNRKFEIRLTPQSLLSQLLNEIEKETEIPAHCQRVIYNGRDLKSQSEDLRKNLEALGLKSPAKILVLGKKPDEEDENYKMMKKWEGSCDTAAGKLQAIHSDLQEMEKGFAPKQLLQENLPKMAKQIHAISEELMKVLEALDGLTFTEAQKEARAKRKVLIDKIHSLHDKCDMMTQSVQQLKTRV